VEDGAPPALELDTVTRRFGGVVAVDGLSLRLAPGERVSVIGPNGAGKTTLFRLVAGELKATSGRIHLLGRDVTGIPPQRRARLGLARTFQVSNLFVGLTVAENVRLASQAGDRGQWRFWAPISRDDRAASAARDVLDRVGLTHRAADRVSSLSHGEQRQLEVAMALVTEPKVLLLDEPAAGLATKERAMLRQLLEDLPRTLPLLLIEHDMSLALGLADRVLCMHNGQAIAFGLPEDVRRDKAVQSVYLGRGAAVA
jgi:branched-chain amino acid transport system ATP-binding protein